MEQLAEDVAVALEQLQAQLADLGRDLAEQLDKGQGWPAGNTLRQMQEALRSSEISQAELSRILDEVQRAVAPGNEDRRRTLLGRRCPGSGRGKERGGR